MRRCLLQLPSAARATVVLRFQESWSIEEIAEAFHITPNLARVRLCRALNLLREALDA